MSNTHRAHIHEQESTHLSSVLTPCPVVKPGCRAGAWAAGAWAAATLPALAEPDGLPAPPSRAAPTLSPVVCLLAGGQPSSSSLGAGGGCGTLGPRLPSGRAGVGSGNPCVWRTPALVVTLPPHSPGT